MKEDKYVDVFTIMDHARETVPTLAQGIGGIQQPQLLIPKGGSFDIGMLTESEKVQIPLATPKRIFVRSNFIDAEEFEDVLNLSAMLDERLSQISSKGAESDLVFFDSRNYSGACKLSGTYVVGEGIQLQLKFKCGDESEKMLLTGEDAEDLIKQLLKVIGSD